MIDPLSGYPGYLLRRASAVSMARLAKRLKSLNLSPADATILNVIDANPNANQSDIGRLLDIARANMAPLVSRLAARDLIERQPVDKRSHGLVLTRAGRSLTGKIKKIFAAHEAELLARIPASQREGFFSCVRALMTRGDVNVAACGDAGKPMPKRRRQGRRITPLVPAIRRE